MRSEAQKQADKKYRARTKDKYAIIAFRASKEEAEAIDEYLRSIDMTKIDFLRWAINAYKDQSFFTTPCCRVLEGKSGEKGKN